MCFIDYLGFGSLGYINEIRFVMSFRVLGVIFGVEDRIGLDN